MPPIVTDFLGRRVDFLGNNTTVDLTTAAAYTIFTTGSVINRAPSGKTCIAFVTISPNTAKSRWDPGTCTFSIDSAAWATSQELSLYFDIPSVIYPLSNPQIPPPGPYANNYAFNFNLSAGNANNGTATIAAYGWCF